MSEQQPLLPVSGQDINGNENTGITNWHEKTAHVLESGPLHKFIIALISIDAICVLADLGYSFLSPNCAPPGPEAPIWLEVLSRISLVITTIFLIEIPLSLWAFGLKYVNPFGPVPHASLHLFDGIIILTTFTLEAVLRGRERELAGLLIILRLWRLVKLVGGVAVGAGELEEENAKLLAETRLELEGSKHLLAEVLEENQNLKRRLSQLLSSAQ